MGELVEGAVGFVGLGMMGRALVGRLLEQRIPVVAWNRSPGPVRAARRRGAVGAASPREVGERSGTGIVFTMVTDGTALRSVLFGRRGLAEGLPRSGLVVDLSTVLPSDSIGAARRLKKSGHHFLDVPVGGSVDAAAAGRLLYYVGGDPADLERVRPVLERIGRGVEAMGPVGAGAAMKFVNNLITIGTVSMLCEAVAVGEATGIPRARVLDVLGKGGAASTMLESKRTALAARRYPARFKLVLARKDLRLFEKHAKTQGVAPVGARAARRWFDAAVREGRGNADFSAVFETVRRPRRPR